VVFGLEMTGRGGGKWRFLAWKLWGMVRGRGRAGVWVWGGGDARRASLLCVWKEEKEKRPATEIKESPHRV